MKWREFFESRQPGAVLKKRVDELDRILIVHAEMIEWLLDDMDILTKTTAYKEGKYIQERRNKNVRSNIRKII